MERLKRVFVLPGWLAGLLGIGMGCALGWVFAEGYDRRWFAYPIFVGAFYALVADCVWLVPRLLAWGRKPPEERRIRFPTEAPRDFEKSLYLTLGVNVVYGGFYLFLAWMQKSWWMGSNGIYYVVNALILGVLAACQRNLGRLADASRREYLGWRAYELCGGLLFLLNLTMTGLVFQIIWRGHGESYPGRMVFAVAAYTFYKLTVAIVRVIQCRKNQAPILGVARNMDMIEALMSLFQLQTGLFAAFGQDFPYVTLMNCLTGGAVCLSVVLGALGMMLHGRRRRLEIVREA